MTLNIRLLTHGTLFTSSWMSKINCREVNVLLMVSGNLSPDGYFRPVVLADVGFVPWLVLYVM